MVIDDLNAFQTLTKKHSRMRWTHLYNPVAYTQLTPHYKKMEFFVKKCSDDNEQKGKEVIYNNGVSLSRKYWNSKCEPVDSLKEALKK